MAVQGGYARGRGGPRWRKLVFEPLESRRLLAVDLAELARLLPTADAADTQHALDGFGVSVAIDADTAVIGAYSDAGARPLAGAAYVYTRSGGNWTLQQKLTASDAQLFDQFGYSVAISGDTILVGSLLHDSGGLPDTGAAYVFTRSGDTWSEQQKLSPGDAAARDLFGGALAIDGDTAVVGAFGDDTAGGVDAGSAYVFVRSGGTWTEQQKLTAPDAAAGDAFGVSLALQGSTLIAGAYQKDLPAGADAGAAYVFVHNGTSWSVQQTLTSPTAAAGDGFGSSVALDGDTAVIGAYSDDTAGGADAGSAAVWTRSGSTWTQQQQLFAADAAAGDGFGISVRIEASTILVGAYQDDTAAGADSGSVYVFTETGGSWTQQQQLTADDAAGGDAFGFGIAISGATILAGAFRDDTAAGSDAGSAYFFTWDAAVWNQSQQVYQTDQDARNDMFGTAVSVDGNTLLIGAPQDDVAGLNAGAAYVFVRSGASWVLQQKLTAPAAAPDDRFGSAVSLQGETLVVGAPLRDIGSSADAGAVYVFTRAGSSWTYQQTLSGGDAAAGDHFGTAVALGEGTLIVGAPDDDTAAGVDAGSAYVFVRAGEVWTQQQKLAAADGASGDRFGQTVAYDADTAVIGAPQDDLFASRDAGSAYVFVRNGTWAQQQKLLAPVPYSGAAFGSAVAIRGDLAVVSAEHSDVAFVPQAGTVYTFTRSGSQWGQQQQLAASNPASYDRFGHAVAVGEELLIVGADLRDTPAGSNAGSVFVFGWNDGTWTQQQELRGSGGYASDTFGSAVALSGLTLAVGAPLADLAGGNSGAAYVFGPDDQVPPMVAGTVPSIRGGGTLRAGTRTLTVQFSEPVLGAGQAASYRLQALGPDGLLGTADDTVLPVTAAGSGTAAVLNFPALPESLYRLTIRGTITDAAGNLLDGDSDGVAGGDAEYEFAVVPSELNVFASSSEYPVGPYAYPTAVAAADFSGDGIADLAAVDSTGSVVLALGDGAGGFAAVGTFPSGGSAPWSLAAGDFDGDGNSDLVTANTSSGGLGILLGNGRGGFTATATYSSGGSTPWHVTIGDFNGDGNADLAAANASNVGVLLGNGMGGFGPATVYASGGSMARAVCVGDFDGDGNADLAVANSGSNTVGILLGDGAGGFAAVVAYPTGGTYPRQVVAGDFNGDGKTDLVVTHSSSNNLGVLLGNGAGGFAAAVIYTTGGSSPDGLAAGDFDGDGKSDLAVANSANLTILRGNGSGGFAVAATHTASVASPRTPVPGDFNRDGKLDVAVANYSSHTLGVLLGDGSGGFDAATTFAPGGAAPGGAISGDFNGDGYADLAVANSRSNNLSVLLGNGGGGFAAPATYASGGAFGSSTPRSVAAGDFNADGRPDLAVANYVSGTVGVLLGNGAGGFAPAATYSSGNTPAFVVAGDFNADGRADLAVALLQVHRVSILLSDPAGGFAPAVTYPSGGNSPLSLAVADFNGDGQQDLVVANSNGRNLGVLLGDGVGGFAPAVTYSLGTAYPSSVTTADFNGDGKLDLAVAVGSQVGILLGNGSGGFGAATFHMTRGSTAEALIAGDFNADGREDLAVANSGSENVSILWGNGAGGFTSAAVHVVGGRKPLSLTRGDYNGDGRDDLAVANDSSHNISVLWGRDAGGFATPLTYSSGGSNPHSVAVGDFNGDGRNDLIVANSLTNNLGLLLGDGAGGFATPVTLVGGGTSPKALAVGDFNGDGKLDVAQANDGSHNLSVRLGNGTGGFATPSSYAIGGTYPRSVSTGDFNGDGRTDLVVANNGSHTVAVLLGNGSGGFADPVVYGTGGANPVSVVVGDFNADGRQDLAVANYGGNNVGLLLGDGSGAFAAAVTFSAGGLLAYWLAVSDFNSDGYDDLAVANYGSNEVGVMLGDGRGGFAAAITYRSGGSGPYLVTVGDFNGDGHADLAVPHYQSSSVGVLLGDGAGGFNVAASYPSGGVSSPAGATGDFDSDGRDDFAAANYGSGNVGVFLNTRQYHPGVRELQAPSGIRFAVQARGYAAGQLVAAAGSRLDGAGRLEVAGQAYAPQTASDFLTDGGRTVVTPTARIAGLYVHREITVPAGGSEDFARTIDVFTNPTAQPISTTVQIISNLGSDRGTTVWKTSDGDATVEPTDQWIGTDDADGVGTPAAIHLLHGPAGLAPTAVSLGGDRGDNLQWTYEITVPAGETLRLAHFTVLAETRADAEAAAAALVTPNGFGGQAAAFMTQAEQDALANFSFIASSDLTIDADEFSAGDNSIRLAKSGGRLVVTIDGVTALDAAADQVNSLTINGQAGNDTLTVDFSGGNPVPAGGLAFHGGDPVNGTPGDALVLDRGSSSGLFQAITHTLVSSSDGSIHLDPDGPGSMPASLITYSGLEPVSDNLDAADRIFSFTGGTETIKLADAAGSAGYSRITSTLGEAVTFANPSASLTVDTSAGSGADTIQVEGLDAAFDAGFIVKADSDDMLRFQANPTDLGTGRVDLAAGNIRFAATVSTTGAARLEALAGSILREPAGFHTDLVAGTAVLIASGGIGEIAGIQWKPLQLSVSSLEAASGSGALVLYNDRALTLGGVTDTLNGITSGRHIDIVADGDLLVAEPVTNTTGAGYTDLTGNTITINANVFTGGSDSLIVSENGGDIVLNATIESDAGTAQLLSARDLTINGSILSQGAQVQLAAQNDVLFTASGLIDAEVSPVATQPLMLVDAQAAIWMADGARIDARDGQIYMTSVADMTIGSLAADWYVFLYSESGSIRDGGDAHPDIISETAELIAGVGTADNPLETRLDELTADSPGGVFVTNAGPLHIAYSGVRAAGDVQIAAGGALTLSAPVISDATVLLSSADPIIDGRSGTDDLVAAAAALSAAGGIGHGDALETKVGHLAYHNTGSGNVEISNAAGLAINSVGPLTSSFNTGDTILLAAGTLTFATDSVQSSLSGRAVDSIGNLDDIAVQAGVTISATIGDIHLRARDRIIIFPTATVQAAAGSGMLVLESAYADTDGAGSMTLDGAISAGSTVTLNLNAASGSASQAGTGRITAAGLQLLSTGGGSFDLAASTSNQVAILAGDTAGAIAYRDSGDLVIGTVTTEGIATSGHAVTIHAPLGTLIVDAPITTTPGTGGEVVLIGSVVVNDLLTAGAGTITLQARTADIVGRHVFYNHSQFDGNDPAANAQDDLAIAGDKTALLPGHPAGFANYTSYVRGINGIMVDIAGLANAEALQVGQFEFRAGNSGDPATWTAATPSSVSVRVGAGRDGSDRVTLIWPDGAIRKQWLQITVRADTVTGLAAPDVFYFGNAVAESGNSAANAFVDGSDFAGARDNFRDSSHPAPVDFRFDYNRDSFVDGTDLAIARDFGTNFLTALSLITAPAAVAGGSAGPAPLTYTSGESEAAEEPLLLTAWSFHDSRTNRPADSADAPSAARPAAASPQAWRGGIEAAHSQRQRVQGELPRPREGRESAFSSRTDLTHPFGDLLSGASDPLDAILDAIAAEVGRAWAG